MSDDAKNRVTSEATCVQCDAAGQPLFCVDCCNREAWAGALATFERCAKMCEERGAIRLAQEIREERLKYTHTVERGTNSPTNQTSGAREDSLAVGAAESPGAKPTTPAGGPGEAGTIFPLTDAQKKRLHGVIPPRPVTSDAPAWRVLVNEDGEPYAVENASVRLGVDTEGNVESRRAPRPDYAPDAGHDAFYAGYRRACADVGHRFLASWAENAWAEYVAGQKRSDV